MANSIAGSVESVTRVATGTHPFGLADLSTLVAEPWDDWGLIDCGNGRKLERYGDDLLGVRGAFGDQPGPPPGGDLAHAPVQVRRLMAGRPRYKCSSPIVHALGWASSRRIRALSRRLPRRGRPDRGRSASAFGPWAL